MIVPFKNRTFDKTKPVFVYRNLHKKGYSFSVQQNGKVVGHTENIILKDCEFIVNRSGLLAAHLSGQRNVHAKVRGYICDDIMNSFSFDLFYHLESGNFFSSLNGTRIIINKASRFYIDNKKVWVQI